MNVPPEISKYLESTERREDGPDPNNPTNDITVPLKLPFLRLPTAQINLASIELPVSQYVIEQLWNRIFFSEGIALVANTEAENAVRQFTVQLNGVNYISELPLFLNPVIDVDATDPTAPVFTTQFSHALDLRASWSWNAPITLISTPLQEPGLIELTGTNLNLTVIDDFTFQLSGVPAGTVWINPSGVFGYVLAPPIPGPEFLAQVVTDALNLVIPGTFSVTYDPKVGQFTLTSLRLLPSCRSDGGRVNTNDAIFIVIQNQNSLPARMGFGVGTVPVPVERILLNPINPEWVGSYSENVPKDCTPPSTCVKVSLQGGYGYQCYNEVQLLPGNYSEDTLRQQLDLQWNRFFFDPGETADPTTRANFVFSDASGTIHTIPIEYGFYTPDQLASFLEAAMNAADSLGNTYSVTFDSTAGQFVFESTTGTQFGLEFGLGTDTVHFRLGFQPVCYRGRTVYRSTDPFVFGSNTFVYVTVLNTSQHRYCIHVCKRPCFSIVVTDLGNGLLEITSQPPAPTLIAHGFRVEDVVELRITALGTDPFLMRVVEVVDAFTFRVDQGSVPASGFNNSPGTVCQSGLVIANLFFNSSLRRLNSTICSGTCLRPVLGSASLPPRVLGFGQRDVLYPTTLCAPFSADVNTPDHVLMLVRNPDGSTHQNHSHKNTNIPNVFAKIIMFPQFRMERIYPMIMYLPQVQDITEMRFLILNPDHTPYQFHGKEWSATLLFAVAQNTSSQLLAH